jgi:hypothetical protein
MGENEVKARKLKIDLTFVKLARESGDEIRKPPVKVERRRR